MRLWNSFLTRGLGASLQVISTKVFTALIKSPTFRKTVAETENAILRGIRFAGNPEKETHAFHKSQKETVEYLAAKARETAANRTKVSQQTRSAPSVPPNMTPSGYQPESDFSRWIKTQRYELGVLKRRWFG